MRFPLPTSFVPTLSRRMVSNMATLDIPSLQAGTPKDQASLIRAYLADLPAADIPGATASLLDAVSSGSIITERVVQSWLGLTRSTEAVAAFLLDPLSNASARRVAMKHLYIRLRDPQTEASMVQAVGGAQGLAELVTRLSDAEVTCLRDALVKSNNCRREDKQTPRGAMMTELHNILTDEDRSPDSRHLGLRFALLAPVCGDDGLARLWFDRTCQAKPSFPGWSDTRDSRQIMVKLQGELCRHWPATCKERLTDIFSSPSFSFVPHGKNQDERSEDENWTNIQKLLERFLRQDLEFGLGLLAVVEKKRSIKEEADRRWTADRLLDSLAWHASKDSTNENLHAEIWERILALLHKHPGLRLRPRYGDFTKCARAERGILYFAIKSWERSMRDEGSSGSHNHDQTILSRLLPFFNSDMLSRVEHANMLRIVTSHLRWTLLRTFCRQAPGYNFDIGDVATKGGKEASGTTDLKDRFSGENGSVFFALPPTHGLVLFERMLVAHGDYTFLLKTHEKETRPAWADIVYPDDYADGHRTRASLIQRWLQQEHTQTDSDAVTSLLDPEAVLRQLKEEQVPRRQKQAEQARDPDQRCWWAAAAVRLGVTIAGALGDMVLYRNMALWTQRFLRDQPTVHELFAYKNPFDSDAKNILGVLPPSTRDFGAAVAVPSDIVERLRGADGAILELFRTSLLAIREPGFQSRTWTRTHEICGAVIRARLDRAHNLGWDDNKLWEEVLQPTLRLAIEAERILLQPSDDEFDAQGTGLLKEWQSPKPHTHVQLRFLDELAEARDAIWRERRRRAHPIIDTLGDKKWPWGLPVQCLLPDGFFGRIDGMPYIKRRVEAALFCDPEFALSPVSLIKRDAETKAAVGGFVDDWHTALKLYLSGVNDPAERKNLLAKVAQHALGPLTGDRMGPTTGGAAARCFWREHFRCVTKIPSEMRELAPGIDDSMLPVFPEDLGLHEATPVVWDPRPEAYRRNDSDSDSGSGSTQTNLPEPVNITLMLSNPTRHVMLGMSMPWPTADFNPSAYNDIYRAWSCLEPADLGRLSGASLDAFSAVALLTADLDLSRCYQPEDGTAVDPRLLAGDATSTDKLRYPSLLLDDDFLRGYKKMAKTCGRSLSSMLENLGPAVQAEALVLLTTANLRLVLRDQAEDGNIQRHVHSFIDTASYLRHGDKPDYAADILIDFVKQVPDGSAYHRDLFHPGTLKHFSPRVLDKFFSSLADHIIDGLAGQAAASKERKEEDNDNEGGGKGANKGPRVKITTAKILPQLLQDGRIASTDFKFSMLERLLLTTRHIDIRAAATTSLVSAAAGHSSSPSTHRALAALRKHIVPIAAAMNERCPETEADWLAAEADPFKPLPEVSSGDDASRPMLSLLARGGCPSGSPGGSSSKAILDLALEAFRASGENNRRWTLLFLKKHRLDEIVSPDSVPPVPTYPKAYIHTLQLLDVREVSRQDWDMVTRYAKLMATTTRETTSAAKTRSKAEKAPMAAAVARVQENKKLMATDEARHFLDMYYLASPFKALNFGGSWAIGLIPALRDAYAQRGGGGTQKNEKEPCISVEEAVEFAYDFVNAFITSGQDRAFASAVNSIQTSLEEAGGGGGGESSGVEEDPSNKLVRRLLRRVNELRTDEWQADPERHPPRLPDTLPLEVRAMGVPTAAQARSLPLMRSLASKLVAQLDRLGEAQAPCHDDLDWIASFYRGRPACLPLALLVGRPTLAAAHRRAPSARDHLRVHLALRMLRNADYRGERRGKLLRATLAMMEGWECGPVEHYRRQVFATANKQFQIDTRNRVKRLDGAEEECDGWPEPDDDRAWEEEDSRKRGSLKHLFKPGKSTWK